LPHTLENRVAVVTGAGRGIGRGVAIELARHGAKVIVNDAGVSVGGADPSATPAQETVSAIRAAGGEAAAVIESVASMQGGGRIVQAALDTFGRLDIVVTAAGILRDRMVYNMSEEEWDAVIGVHLKGTFSVVQPASKLFRQQRSGRIVTFTSESGLIGFAGQANYGAAKSGIAGFTKVVARDLGKYGVTANSIAPRAATRMLETIPDVGRQKMAEAGFWPKPGERMWEPEDVAPFAAYLASDYAAPVNGQVFLVYGGTVALLSQPRRLKTIFKPASEAVTSGTGAGRWSLDELDTLVRPRLLGEHAAFESESHPSPQPSPSRAEGVRVVPTPAAGEAARAHPPRASGEGATGIPSPSTGEGQGEGARSRRAGRLAGKVAVVTGAGRGIGRGIAILLARHGAAVVVSDAGVNLDGSGTDKSPAAKVVEEIAEAGGRAVACYENVATVQGGKNIVDAALKAFGRLDIVVTAAGILRDRMIFNMTEQEWDDVIAVHLKGTFDVVQPAAKLFKEQGSGRIITFSSVSGLYGYSGQANYGAAKDGIAGFTRVVAKDLARYGVTVNAISPGAQTRMTASVPQTTRVLRGGTFGKPPEGVLTADPEDVAPMVGWLASDASAGVTGQVFHCVGNRVSLMGHPEVVRSIYKDGRWTLEELAAVFPETLGTDLINPALPQEPEERKA
jgi:multifunctional beta-oxidation protein